MADESSDWSSRRIPFIIALVAVVALGAGYFLYVRNQSAYYSGRNLRILARASALASACSGVSASSSQLNFAQALACQ